MASNVSNVSRMFRWIYQQALRLESEGEISVCVDILSVLIKDPRLPELIELHARINLSFNVDEWQGREDYRLSAESIYNELRIRWPDVSTEHPELEDALQNARTLLDESAEIQAATQNEEDEESEEEEKSEEEERQASETSVEDLAATLQEEDSCYDAATSASSSVED